MDVACTEISITEGAIRLHGAPLLARWAYLKSRCSNSVIYLGYNERRNSRTGWGRSKLFRALKELCAAGLARRTPQGHYRLSGVAEIKKGVRHKCTLRIPRGCDERHVHDLVLLKLMEMAHRQRLRHELPPTPKMLAKRERIKLLEERQVPRSTSAETTIFNPLLGEGRQVLEESASEGWAPMNTEKLMSVTGLGRSAFFAWKRRMKARGMIRQRDRWQHVPDAIATCFPEHIRSAEVRCLGRVSQWGSGYRFHQASTYQMLCNYQQ